MLRPTVDYMKSCGIWIPRIYFANPLGRFGVCGSGCCGPTSCEDPVRPIAYVDKYATGAGDGSSWTDAYTTIQAAINAVQSTKRIYIQGYGISDPYNETLNSGFFNTDLVGVGSLWISGSQVQFHNNCCYYNTNLLNSWFHPGSGAYSNSFVSCIVDGQGGGAYSLSTGTNSYVNNCTVRNITSTRSTHTCYWILDGSTAINSTATDISLTVAGIVSFANVMGFNVFTGSSVESCSSLNLSITCSSVPIISTVTESSGFIFLNSATALDCYSYECTASSTGGGDDNGSGFKTILSAGESVSITNCISSNNSHYGYYKNTDNGGGTVAYTGSTGSGNGVALFGTGSL